MRTISFEMYIALILMILSLIALYPAAGYSQMHPVEEVKFEPPDPQAGGRLSLNISLSPSKYKEKEVSIRLITWRDLNNDCKYTEEGEEVKHGVIRVKDNEQGKDEESFADEMLVRIYDIPVDHPPRKYTAIVTFGGDSKSASIIVPPKKKVICNPADVPLDWSFRKMLGTPYEVAKKLSILKDVLKRAGAQEEYQGAHGLYTYDLKGKKVEKMARSSDALYLSPAWSFDSGKLSLIVNQGGKKKIAWIYTADKKVRIVTEGPSDRDPFWLPDDKHIIFIRDNRFHVINIKRKEVKAIAKDIRAERILGVSQGTESTVQVIYEAPNPYTNETNEVYMLELSKQLKQKDVSLLVNSPIWFLAAAVSPSGDQAVYSERDTLVISLIKGEQAERLFEDGHYYYEPSWSPDGDRIVFISDRTE